MNVFLSHSTKDGGFVQRLATALEASGFTPWLCEVDIERGANFVAKINEGLAQSDVALLIWSQHAANSAWTLEEWTAALARQVEENRIRLGIVLLRDCPMPLPPLLRTKNYVDARADEPAGIDGVLGWLKKRQQSQRLSGLRAPVYLPDYRPQDFVGRSAYLTRLQDTLTAEPGVFLLYGEPGAGKSTLALRFAWDAQKDFDAVIFQTCGQRPLDAITAELAERLPIDVKTLAPEMQRDAAKEWLRERQSLLVLDDVWSPEMRQLEPGPNCSVLYTSRLKALPGLSSELREQVESFSEAEAEALFQRYLDRDFGAAEVAQHRAALLDFARRVEMLPFAVAVGASLLRGKTASPLDEGALELRMGELTDGVKSVPGLFQKAIASQPEREQKLLAACAVCVQAGFWLPLARDIAELSDNDAKRAAESLVNSSLLRVVDRERRRFNLHALLREVAAATARQQGNDCVRLQERHAAALEGLFKDWESRWQDCGECLEEIIPAASFVWGRGETSREDWLTYWGYRVAQRTGELDGALRILKQEESFWAGRGGNAAKNALQRTYGNQALILADWGRLEEALALHKKEEAIVLELGDKDGLQATYGNQALILQAWGRLEEALALLKKQEEICIELGNRDSLQISYGNQALILQAWGRLEEALALLKKQEEICIELGNKDSLQRSYGNRALILADWGRLEEALALHEKQEAICRELGNKDGLQASYGNQALILMQQKCFNEALILLQESEAICTELGLRDRLGYCHWYRGWLAGKQGDHKTEKEKLEQALAIFTELKMPRERDAVQKEVARG